jgi:hypothetical protein
MSESKAKNAEHQTATEKKTKDATPEMKTGSVQVITEDIGYLWQWFLDNEGIGGSLTGTDRRRLIGVGVRNNGFIVQVKIKSDRHLTIPILSDRSSFGDHTLYHAYLHLVRLKKIWIKCLNISFLKFLVLIYKRK